MTLTDRIEQHLQQAESKGLIVSTSGNNALLMGYYRSLGVDGNTSVNSWLFQQASGKIPNYTSVERAIRKCRERNTHWRKPTTQKKREVTNVKEEVGYHK